MSTNVLKHLLCVAGMMLLSFHGWVARAEGPTRPATDLPEVADPSPAPSPDVALFEARFTDAADRKIELVTERYPDRTVRVQREVTLDSDHNYVNHGSYTMYDRGGTVLRTGKYDMGKQNGQWMQVFESGQGDLFSGSLNRKFPGPFVSKAKFLDGQLHGTWTITSQTDHKIIQWNLDRGVRHGLATWWYPNGVKRCELTYEHGAPAGEYVQWDQNGKQIGTTQYIDGRPLIKKVEWYKKNQKMYEGTALAAQDSDQPKFDWLNTRAKVDPAPVKIPEMKHGLWTVLHPNGSKKIVGSYDRGMPVGEFTWWYENGQKQAEGCYEKGLQVGTWITWHANGMKESRADYSNGEMAGKWMRWEASGRLVEMQDYSDTAPAEAVSEAIEQPTRPVETADGLEGERLELSFERSFFAPGFAR